MPLSVQLRFHCLALRNVFNLLLWPFGPLISFTVCYSGQSRQFTICFSPFILLSMYNILSHHPKTKLNAWARGRQVLIMGHISCPICCLDVDWKYDKEILQPITIGWCLYLQLTLQWAQKTAVWFLSDSWFVPLDRWEMVSAWVIFTNDKSCDFKMQSLREAYTLINKRL